MKYLISSLVILLGMAFLYEQTFVETCFEKGGVWKYEKHQCYITKNKKRLRVERGLIK